MAGVVLPSRAHMPSCSAVMRPFWPVLAHIITPIERLSQSFPKLSPIFRYSHPCGTLRCDLPKGVRVEKIPTN
jgi:hypothetical protein